MPKFVELPVCGNGLLVEGEVWLSPQRREAMFRAGRQDEVGAPIRVTLIIDTGADSTMLNDQLMRSLGLTPTSQARVITSGSRGVPEPCDVYDVSLEIKGSATQEPWRVSPVAVLARPLVNQGTDGMIGRDLLRLGVLQYDGPKGTFSLTYP